MDHLEEYLEVAIELAQKGGQMIRDASTQEFTADEKQNRRDLVTQFDKAIEKYIFDALKGKYPDHVFIGEESAGTKDRIDNDKPTWIVDPIDGTMNFTHHYPLCSVSIGLAVEKQLVVGVIYAPFLNKLYTAIKGKGAKCNGSPIHVSGVKQVADSLILSEVAFGRSLNDNYMRRLYDNLLWKSQTVRMIGSSCICLGMIAEGSADVFFHVGLCVWDMAAGYVIVTEAGGTLVTINGDPFDPHCHNVLAAANADLAKEVAQHTAINRPAAKQ